MGRSIGTWAAAGLDRLNEAVAKSRAGKYFKLDARKTCFTKEVRAGTATFLSMAYILAANATILTDSGGTCAPASPAAYQACLATTKRDLITATAASAIVGSCLMGLLANLPLALAPGMGANAYFAYTLVGIHGSGGTMSYSTALAVVLAEGFVFLLVAVLGLRARLAWLVPRPVRLACGAGIGLFLAFIGLQAGEGVGLVGFTPSTLLTLAACPPQYMSTSPSGATQCTSHRLQSPTFWLGAGGFMLTCYCLMKNLKGGMIYGILAVTLISWPRGTPFTYFPETPQGDELFSYFKQVVGFHGIETTALAYSFRELNKPQVWVAMVTLLYVNLLDTTGTMYSMAEYGGLIDNTGQFEGQYMAFVAEAGAVMVGSALGTSPVATFVESSAGIREGGRTGVTALAVAAWFSLALLFAPVVASVPPWAVGPALVAVGAGMVGVVREIEWGDMKEAAPAFVTMLLMPLTYSVSNGLLAGIMVYVVLRAGDVVQWMMGWWRSGRSRIQNQGPATATVVEGQPPAAEVTLV
ncbi:adenine/guanine permease AZG1 [Amborella trichopoda]|uniref:Uncharacterized protein n=1 Tax=Amborella trichopoda TaxID=13333 RepID=W1PBM4_AMBTC|nr:adenine/guanine permease AZG1 [Amborella trichopoda]ERN04435.1 hypothetical protein AMTR_s00133p00085410 [Amborella trichopoda]|eukprot:XP_006842760.1 adenine/guanine permease AZG1 [Amborella trichopoda]